MGVIFFPAGEAANAPPLQARIDALVRRQGLSPLGWRRVPLDTDAFGAHARASARDPSSRNVTTMSTALATTDEGNMFRSVITTMIRSRPSEKPHAGTGRPRNMPTRLS